MKNNLNENPKNNGFNITKDIDQIFSEVLSTSSKVDFASIKKV